MEVGEIFGQRLHLQQVVWPVHPAVALETGRDLIIGECMSGENRTISATSAIVGGVSWR
jgi:hypothetical protein